MEGGKQMGQQSGGPVKANTEQFDSIDDAIAKVKASRRYKDVADECLFDGMPLPTSVFFFSIVSRCDGLHLGIQREIEHENPHAVFPLIRAFTEAVTHLIYVTDHVEYIDVLMKDPKDSPKTAGKPKSMQKLIAHASKKEALGLKHAYAELSDLTHFSSLVMWAPYTVSDDGSGFSWSSAPRWKKPEDALLACALTLELANATVAFLRRFAGRYMPKPVDVAS